MPDLQLRTAGLVLVGALLHSVGAFAQPIAIIDLLDVPTNDGRLLRVLGAHGTGQSGLPVAGGHDLDNDGFEDYAVGHLRASPSGRSLAGEVSLVFGDGTISGEIDLEDAQARALVIWGDQNDETTGNTISIDDVTGDGIGDLLICRQNHTPVVGRTGAGALTIVKGGPELQTFANALAPYDLRTPAPAVTVTTVYGASANDRLCVWARTGDVTGDGIADVLVAADQEDAFGEDYAGGAYLLLGGAHLGAGGTLDLANLAAPALSGKVAHIEAPAGFADVHLGGTVLIADLDGNAKGEVLIAATLNRITQTLPPAGSFSADGQGGVQDGRVYILWDDNFATPWNSTFEFTITSPPGTLTTLQGPGDVASMGSRFGEDMLGGLDYDGDTEADLFVGDLTASDTGAPAGSGLGWVFYDADSMKGLSIDLDAPPGGLSITKIRGPSGNAIGADTMLHGDYDGDGIGDLAFCSPLDDPQLRLSAGSMHVFRGRLGGWPALIDTAALPPLAQVETVEIHGAHGTAGADTGDILCYSASSGDVDGDGLTDLIVNEMEGNGSSVTDAGNLLVIDGGALFPLFLDDFETGNTSRWSKDSTIPP